MKKCGDKMDFHKETQRIARRLHTLKWMTDVTLHPGTEKAEPDKLVLFDTAINSQNMGDSIIAYYCTKALSEIIAGKNVLRVPTHTLPSEKQLAEISHAGGKIVCGTNLITPHFEEFSNWKMPSNLEGYRDIVTMGVGWGYYCDEISKISKFAYRTVLSKKKLHSVRDGYTERKFREMGIKNVVNTGCPTLWGLTPEHCARIPQKKASRVITTLTDYDRDPEADRFMLDILKSSYKQVFVWLQGTEDFSYLQSLIDPDSVQIIDRDLEQYTKALDMGDVDYVGTRLHAGIHAMNRGVRTIILAVDNRATEMGRDFNLPVMDRSDLEHTLMDKICSQWETSVKIPIEQIDLWKANIVR